MHAPLRQSAIRGGAYVAGRQATSLVLALGGTIALTWLLGPSGYGRFAAALALVTYAGSVAQLGVNAWLVRRDGEEREDVYATVRSLLVGSAVVVALVGAMVVPLVERWLGGAGVRALLLAMLAGLPVQLALLVPLASLERALRFRDVALTEMLGQVVLYVVSIGLAAAQLGPWAMVAGWWAQHLVVLWRVQAISGQRVRFGFDARIAREALAYGVTYASTIWTWQIKDLVNPLIVGRWGGVEGVAQVALTVRLVEAAAFAKQAAWRISLPALSRLQNEPARLAAAVRDGMRLQLLALGPIFLALVLVGPLVIPWVFGDRWLAVRPLLPFVAGGVLANATYNLHSSALYARARNGRVLLFHIVFVALFGGAAWTLVPLLGVTGVGFAEIVALPAYAVIYWAFVFEMRTPADPHPAPQWRERMLGGAFVIAVIGTAWAPWMAAVALVPFVVPSVRAGAVESLAQVRAAITARSSA